MPYFGARSLGFGNPTASLYTIRGRSNPRAADELRAEVEAVVALHQLELSVACVLSELHATPRNPDSWQNRRPSSAASAFHSARR